MRWKPRLSMIVWLAAGCSSSLTGIEPWQGRAPREDGPAADGVSGQAHTGTQLADAGADSVASACAKRARHPNPVGVRRLSRIEYNNTLRDLLSDTTSPGNALPSEPIGNNFGNEASLQSVSSLLAEQYGNVAEAVAARATATPEALATLLPCAAKPTSAGESACVKSGIEQLGRRAFRRPLQEDETQELLDLWKSVRATSDVSSSFAAVLEAMLQSPDFLYRVEVGEPATDDATVTRPTGYEMATRLSYLYWETMPDELLLQAAEAGELSDPVLVRQQAQRLLNTESRAQGVVRFFFDSLLPISGLSSLSRDSQVFPEYNPKLGSLLREETQQYLKREIFGDLKSWPEILTEPYTYLNQTLADFYGVEGVSGDDFQKVALDTSQRLGLLTQAGVLAGTAHSNVTSPVLRGSFVVQRLFCRTIPLPSGDILAQVKPPEPSSGRTGRERYAAHSSNEVCRSCHQYMDPVGFALENYDAMGLYRDSENGVQIDPSGELPDANGGAALSFAGPLDLVRDVASSDEALDCFAAQWMSFAYGQSSSDVDECTVESMKQSFKDSGYQVRQLLLSLSGTDAFLYMSAPETEAKP